MPGPFRSALSGRLITVAAVGMALGLGAQVIRTQSIYYSDETGTGLRDAEQIARYLKTQLQPGDRILAATPSEAPLEYYLHLNQVPVTYLFVGLGFTNRLFVVVNEPRQTLEELVGAELRTSAFTPPTLLQHYPFASLYEIRKRL